MKGRRPEWKAHTGHRQANAAIAYRGYGRAPDPLTEVWEFVDGVWVQVK